MISTFPVRMHASQSEQQKLVRCLTTARPLQKLDDISIFPLVKVLEFNLVDVGQILEKSPLCLVLFPVTCSLHEVSMCSFLDMPKMNSTA